MLRIGGYIRLVAFALAAATGFGAVSNFEANAQPHSAPRVSGIATYAVELAFKGDFIRAGGLARRSSDGAAMKLVELLYLRDSPNDAGYQRIMSFLDAAPNWPLAEGLLKRAERSLYVNDEPPELVLGHFKKRQPTTVQGSLAYARALLAKGDRQTALKYVRSAYYNPDIPSELEKQINTEFAALLSTEDYRKRMWRLIYAHESNAAVRASKRLPEDIPEGCSRGAATLATRSWGRRAIREASTGLARRDRAEIRINVVPSKESGLSQGARYPCFCARKCKCHGRS